MIELPWIIALSVVGVAALGILAAFIAYVQVNRRRDRRRYEGRTRNPSLSNYHRAHLSASEDNYEHIQPPPASLQRGPEKQAIPLIWSESEEQALPESSESSSVHPRDSSAPRNAKRKRRLLHGPRPRPKNKSISLQQIHRSPLSAITEFTDSMNDDTSPAELPTEHSPNDRPKKPASITPTPKTDWALAVTKKRLSNSVSTGELGQLARQTSVNRPKFQRSASATSKTSAAPEGPLPPLPSFEIYRPNGLPRNSRTSVDSVSSSVLVTAMASPTTNDLPLGREPEQSNSGLQSFDFGFTSPRLGLPAERHTQHGFRSGNPEIASLRPALYEGYQSVGSETSLARPRDSMQTIDAGGRSTPFNFSRPGSKPNKATARYSMHDYLCISAKNMLADADTGDCAPRLMPPRPASVASSHPFPSNSKPIFSDQRHSISSTASGLRSHREQDRVRIAHLKAPTIRSVKFSEMPEVVEEQTDTQPNARDWTRLGAGQRVVRATASVTDAQELPCPMQNRPILVPSRPSRRSQRSRSPGRPRPDSDIFTLPSPDLDLKISDRHMQASRRWALSPATATNIRLNTATPPLHDMEFEYESPTLPSPTALQPRKSLVKGPRNPPQSLGAAINRLESPGPGGRNNSLDSTPEDLRKSIAMLRSMNTEGSLADHDTRVYPTVRGSRDSAYNIDGVLLSPTKQTSFVFGSSKRKPSVSPSPMSIGNLSIWEDDSVRGDSPEPGIPPSRPISLLHPQPQTPKGFLPYPDPEAYENLPIEPKQTQNEGQYCSPQVKGLGLSIGNAVYGTPGSLYDRDGFLRY